MIDSERQAGKAWALAMLGRQREMEEALAAALRGIDPSLKAVVACVHWKAGKALVAAQRGAEATEHFRAAWQADPLGQSGTASRMELEHLGAF